MPAISAIYDLATPLINEHLEARRDQPYGRDRRALSPTAIGFLVPLFICVLLGPFICVAFTRKCRDGGAQHRASVSSSSSRQKPAPIPKVSREDARTTLSDVTEVMHFHGREEEKFACTGTMNEKDCAICLSTLHAPSPPEPAKLSATDTSTFSSISALSLSEHEEILRLKVCNHEFHAECLISWFVLAKWSCPICRALYYKPGLERYSEERQRQ